MPARDGYSRLLSLGIIFDNDKLSSFVWRMENGRLVAAGWLIFAVGAGVVAI